MMQVAVVDMITNFLLIFFGLSFAVLLFNCEIREMHLFVPL